MSHRGRIVTAMLVVALTAVGGCAAIPESSPVEVIGPQVPETSEPPVVPPPDDLAPLDVARGFVEAAARPANRYAAARAYLVDELRDTWTVPPTMVVIENTFNTGYPPSSGDAQDEDFRQVLLRSQQLGQVGADGAFLANRATITPTMDLVRRDGRWRILRPPDVLHVRFSDFVAAYRSVKVQFVDPSRGTLVSDRRWIVSQPSSGVASRAIDLLLAGPSSALKDAVVNELAGAKIRTNVVFGDNDVLVVDLTGLAPELTDIQRRLAAAQIAGSLREVVAQRIRILLDGAALVPNKAEWASSDVQPFIPDDSVKPDLPALVVSGRRVARLQGGGVEGPAGDGTLPVESAAQSTDGALFAVVGNDGSGPRLFVGPVAGPQAVSLRATSMTRPTWRHGATPEAWTVINDSTGAGVSYTEAGSVVPFNVDLSDLVVKGRIAELRLSRDGVRVAAVVDGALYVAIVVGSGPESSVRNPRLLVGPGAAQIADVDWKGRDTIVVATRSKENPRVYEVSVDGLTWTPYENVNLTGPVTGIAAGGSRPVLVADQGGVWSADEIGALWHSEGFSAGADPVYPG